MNAIKTAFFTLGAAAALAGSAFGQAATTTTTTTTAPAAAGPSTAQDQVVGISGRDGITVTEAGALITRNGVTERMTGVLNLDNGAKVQPDGSIIMGDGTKILLRPGQLLTFDGKLVNGPAGTTTAPAAGGGLR